MITIKTLYPTSEIFFEHFYNSEFTQEKLISVTEKYPKLHLGNKDTTKAVKELYEEIITWLYNHEPYLNEIDIESYLDTYKHDLCSLIHENLCEKVS